MWSGHRLQATGKHWQLLCTILRSSRKTSASSPGPFSWALRVSSSHLYQRLLPQSLALSHTLWSINLGVSLALVRHRVVPGSHNCYHAFLLKVTHDLPLRASQLPSLLWRHVGVRGVARRVGTGIWNNCAVSAVRISFDTCRLIIASNLLTPVSLWSTPMVYYGHNECHL